MDYTRDRVLMDFDKYAADYDETLNRELAISGEDKDYYARQRVLWLEKRLENLSANARSILDFGRGVATNTKYLLEMGTARRVTGTNVLEESIRSARDQIKTTSAPFDLQKEFQP